MVSQEPNQTATSLDQTQLIINNHPVDEIGNTNGLFSPRFKSLAAMAGWDEESIITASLIVEDTPDRQFNNNKHKKRSDLNLKTPPSSNTSRRKRRAQRKNDISISIPVISLDDEEVEPKKQEIQKVDIQAKEQSRKIEQEEDESKKESLGVSCSNSGLPCMDKLREELSCAICLEICFEPSTTSCGHSFCKKCLRSAADKCGKKCPKCRQLISNGRSCTVNTVLWNTIQLLFPQEVEARKSAQAVNNQEVDRQIPPTRTITDRRNQIVRPFVVSASSRDVTARRRGVLSQGEETALAQRSQTEDLSRLLSSYASGISRRAAPRQDDSAELQRESHLSRLLSRDASARRRRGTPSQDEDAALALRLQREEFMDAFRGTNDQSERYLSSARENFRAMAARAVSVRMRMRNRTR